MHTLAPERPASPLKPKCEPGACGISLHEPKKEWASPDTEDDFLLKVLMEASLNDVLSMPM
jgi:hypothetical protein